ncbi:MAG TPA: Uma2 family endonuclease [Bryobacteraceae bacterium]|nr:Uma2 family endonuclease [Bryobacteraceae bacterium]
MGATSPLRAISVEEYLSNPEYRHSEYVDGEVVALNVGTKNYSRIQGKCYRKLDEYLDQHRGGYAATELHCRLRIYGILRFRLPDVCVVLNDADPDADYLDRAPDFVVEIRSPEDSFTGQLRKMNDYFANGTRLAWLILPEEQSVIVLTPDGPPKSFTDTETLDGGNVLPGLSVAVADLFV